MHGIPSAISAIAVHPDPENHPIVAIAGQKGFIYLWNYKNKGEPQGNFEYYIKEDQKNMDGNIFTAIEFTPQGDEILVAQYNGEIKIMDSMTGEWKKMNTALKTTETHKGKPIT